MGKILSKVYEMLSCSPPQIILNTLTVSSCLGPDHQLQSINPELTQSSTSVGLLG